MIYKYVTTLKHLSGKGWWAGTPSWHSATSPWLLGAVLNVSFNVTGSQRLTKSTRDIPKVPKSVSYWVVLVFVLIQVGDVLETMSRRQAGGDGLKSFGVVKAGHCTAHCSLGGPTDDCRKLKKIMIGVCQAWDLTKIATVSVRWGVSAIVITRLNPLLGVVSWVGVLLSVPPHCFKHSDQKGSLALSPASSPHSWHTLTYSLPMWRTNEPNLFGVCHHEFRYCFPFGDLAASPSLLPGDWQEGRMSRSLSLSPLICPFKQRLCHWCRQSCAFYKQ